MARVGIISLGCARNLVDSETLMGVLKKRGDQIVDIEDAQVGIVNTCSFIEDARAESVDTILSLVELKKQGGLKHIIVCGCLSERYRNELARELKEVDGFIGIGDLNGITQVIEEVLEGKRSLHFPPIPKAVNDSSLPKLYLTPIHYRYIKIQEGCGNKCSFCIIPKIKGPLRSRPIEDIAQEVASLPPEVSEVNIIGQDTSLYGMDLYKSEKLADLLYEIAGLRGTGWIRLLYVHPDRINDRLIEVIKGSVNICKYLDLPLQHINDKILKRMNRSAGKGTIVSLIDKLRRRIPGLAIRTTFIVGFPGESEKDFMELVDFVKEMRFERMGVFTYSREEGTKAARYADQIPEYVKTERYNHLMKIQQKVSLDVNNSFLGKELEILIDEPLKDEPDLFLARTQYDAPEVDGQVYVKKRDAKPGEFLKVRITDTLEYDLVAEEV